MKQIVNVIIEFNAIIEREKLLKDNPYRFCLLFEKKVSDLTMPKFNYT